MKVNLEEIINNVRNKLDSVNIILTGLEEEEKEIASILHGNGLIQHNTTKDILVYGSSITGNKKLQKAKQNKMECYSLEEFKEKFLFNHPAKNLLEGKTILLDINFDYKSIMPVYLLNPKDVLWSNQINKRKIQEVDVIITNSNNLDNVKNGLSDWLSDRNYEHLTFEDNTLQEHKSQKFRRNIH